jgi:hypothetical protein
LIILFKIKQLNQRVKMANYILIAGTSSIDQVLAIDGGLSNIRPKLKL